VPFHRAVHAPPSTALPAVPPRRSCIEQQPCRPAPAPCSCRLLPPLLILFCLFFLRFTSKLTLILFLFVFSAVLFYLML
jgi:hypothetical protein